MKRIEYFNNVTIEDFDRYYELKALGLDQYVIINVLSGNISKDDAFREMEERNKRHEEHFKKMYPSLSLASEEAMPF